MAEGPGKFSGASFIRTLIPFMRTLSSGSNHLPQVPPPSVITLGIEFQCMAQGSRNLFIVDTVEIFKLLTHERDVSLYIFSSSVMSQ